MDTRTSLSKAPTQRCRARGPLGYLLRVFMHTMEQAGGEEERVSHKPHDKWEDKGNSVTLRNDVTKKDEELK